MSGLIHSERAGVFAELAEPERFERAFVHQGAVTWPGGQDLAPDAMHDEIAAHGEWVLK